VAEATVSDKATALIEGLKIKASRGDDYSRELRMARFIKRQQLTTAAMELGVPTTEDTVLEDLERWLGELKAQAPPRPEPTEEEKRTAELSGVPTPPVGNGQEPVAKEKAADGSTLGRGQRKVSKPRSSGPAYTDYENEFIKTYGTLYPYTRGQIEDWLAESGDSASAPQIRDYVDALDETVRHPRWMRFPTQERLAMTKIIIDQSKKIAKEGSGRDTKYRVVSEPQANPPPAPPVEEPVSSEEEVSE
jgi:hypothetical protein